MSSISQIWQQQKTIDLLYNIVIYHLHLTRWSTYNSDINKEGDRDLDNLRTYNDFIHQDIKFLGNCVYGTLEGKHLAIIT